MLRKLNINKQMVREIDFFLQQYLSLILGYTPRSLLSKTV